MSISSVMNSARSAWLTITGDRITPAKNACAIYTQLASRAVFPLSMDHPDSQIAIDFFSAHRNLDALFNGVFGPLTGMNSDSTYGFLPWILLADDDEKLQDAIMGLLGPTTPLGRIIEGLSPVSPKFYQLLRENWGNEFEAVMKASEADADGTGGAADADDDTVFVTHPIPLSQTCYFSTRVMHEPTSSNLRSKSRLEVPPHMLIPNWLPPIVTQKFTATSAITGPASASASATTSSAAAAASASAADGGSGGGDLTVSALRVSVLTHLIFRMARCMVMFGQSRDKPSYIASFLSSKLGPLVRRGISKLPPKGAGAVQALIRLVAQSPPRTHRFRTLEKLIGAWTKHLVAPNIARTLLHRERVVDLLLAGRPGSDDARLLSLMEPAEVHANALLLMLPSMAHVYGTPMYGEATRNPLSETRHLNLVECAMPLLAGFISNIADALEAVAASTRQQQQQQPNLQQQPKHPSEKLPRHAIHDVAVPARAALRYAAGIARQSLMSMFYKSSVRSGAGSSSSSSSSAGSCMGAAASLNSAGMAGHAAALWLGIVRAWTALARVVDPAHAELRHYEAVTALFTDFFEMCMRAEAEQQSVASTGVARDVCAVLETLLVLPGAVGAGAGAGGGRQQHPALASAAAVTVSPFVVEYSSALERMQQQGGPTSAATGAIAEALDGSLNVNGLFDFQGEGTTGETVPAWRCFAALMGRGMRPTVAKLYRHLSKSAPSQQQPQSQPQSQQQQQPGEQQSEFVVDAAARARLAKTFSALFGEDIISDATLLDDDGGAAGALARQFGGDQSLSARRLRRGEGGDDDDDSGLTSAMQQLNNKGRRSTDPQRLPYDPRTAVLSAAGRQRLLASAEGIRDRSLHESSDLKFATPQHRGAILAYGSSSPYVPHPDEIALLARWLHTGDVLISAVATKLLRWYRRTPAPLCPVCGVRAAPMRVASTVSKGRRCTVHPSRAATWCCDKCCSSFCAGDYSGSAAAAAAAASGSAAPVSAATAVAFCQKAPLTQHGFPVTPRPVPSSAAEETSNIACCEKCFVVMRPDDETQQFWVERTRTVRCPNCVLPSVRVTLLRWLAWNLIFCFIAIWYVMTWLYWLFWDDGSSATGGPGGYNSYHGAGSYPMYDAQQQQQFHYMMMQQQQHGNTFHQQKTLFVEDFY